MTLTPEYIQKRAAEIVTRSPFALVVRFSGIDVKGVRTLLKMQDAATLSGMDAGYSFSVLLTAAEVRKWSPMPSPLRDRVAIDGKSYLVLAVETDTAGNIRLHLGGEYG